MAHPILEFSPRILCLPIVHGSGDCALEVRRVMMERRFDCLAVPLPASFQTDVEAAIEHLPTPTIVTQRERGAFNPNGAFNPQEEGDEEEDATFSYVPIDPCQPVIAALRGALGERIVREFIDLETAEFRPFSTTLPDAYALKSTSLERFAASILPAIPRPDDQQTIDRVRHMAARLRQLETRHKSILFVCSLLDWPWIREAYVDRARDEAEHDLVDETATYQLDPKTLLFALGELPFVTGLYERARKELEDDANLSIDGVKELLVVARDAYQSELRGRGRKITPLALSQCLRYVRNLTLLDRRLTPDLYTLVVAAKQIAGDRFALQLTETAREYPYVTETEFPELRMGIDQAALPTGDVVVMISRLPGPPLAWRTLELHRRPEKWENQDWQARWNPYEQCSWPPEDERIESFRAHVMERAKALLGADLAKTEKFTTSVKDGIDIRDTLRNWHTGDIYVKEIPPARGQMDCAVMLFDSPADPRDYPWRTTWFAEHHDESTLALFATDYHREMVGPGICVATYGGAMMIYPPRPIPDIWTDPRLDFTDTLEERLLAAACLHSRQRQIALLSPLPPGAGWRRLANRFGKRFIHVPLAQFSDSTIQQLRIVHVLNGKQVRSYASQFIRKA
ncbi:MAG TPA: hypothetical protein PLV92_03210 [Pirellulaceae bacterium]|nr:hypothetical protein [Pirellulaceae bacterium]